MCSEAFRLCPSILTTLFQLNFSTIFFWIWIILFHIKFTIKAKKPKKFLLKKKQLTNIFVKESKLICISILHFYNKIFDYLLLFFIHKILYMLWKLDYKISRISSIMKSSTIKKKFYYNNIFCKIISVD